MNRKLRNVFLVSGATVLSRISGFVRDVLFFSIFGIGDIGAAFLFAFAIPNLFRRLLGEGALSSATVPILAKLYVAKGQAAVISLSKAVIARLLFVLVAITVTGCSLSYFATRLFTDEKLTLIFHFLLLLLPYVIFVCIASIISATLNVFNRFLIASLNAIWLNAAMIAALITGKIMSLSGIPLLNCLSFGVLLGGIVQCFVPLLALRKDIQKNSDHAHSEGISEILKLFWPGLLGAAVSQINLLISKNLAYVYCASAVSILYLANRLAELPLGVFSSAIATVVFPDMSRLSANTDLQRELSNSFNRGIFSLLWILLPSAIGLHLVGRELLSVFFEWGIFSRADTDKIIPILAIYCVSIPFFGIANFLIRSFHAVKDTSTPARIGMRILAINLILTIALAYPFGIQGIALATTLSVAIQTFMLYHKLNNQNCEFHLNINKSKLARIALGLLLMCTCVKFGQSASAAKYVEYKRQAVHTITVYVPLASVVYILFSIPSLKILQKKIRRVLS